MLKHLLPSHLKNKKGMATLEIIPVMIVIALLINYSLGFYGVIQTGLLNSIASRNYAFETFRNRTNLLYFHDSPLRAQGSQYKKFSTRVHGIASEKRGSNATEAYATTRKIGFGVSPDTTAADADHNGADSAKGIFGIQEGVRNTEVDSSPIWIRPLYGLCLNAKCAQ